MTTVTTIDELNKYIDANFHVSIPLEPQEAGANMYVFDALLQEGRDVIPQLVDRMKHEFDLLKAMGATDIHMVIAPELVKTTEDNRFRVRAMFRAVTGSNSPLLTGNEYTEGDKIPLEKPKSEPVAIAGYDLIEDKEEAILLCALLVHNAVKALNDAWNEHTLSWETNRASVIAGVKRTLANPKETPEENHEAWMEFKTIEGWSYGPSKDERLKEHPCMVPYEQLGPHAKSKDLIFQAIVRTFFGL